VVGRKGNLLIETMGMLVAATRRADQRTFRI
jgi:hypothetical protein